MSDLEKKTLVFPATPSTLASINFDYIKDYCKDKKEVPWLKEFRSTLKLSENPNLRKEVFMPIRSAFVDKFFPELKNKKTSSYKNILQQIDEL